jgi:hypothetical protein
MRKATGISFDRSPNKPWPREQAANGKQEGKFAGTAEKNQSNKIAQASLVRVQQKEQVTDSNDEPQPEYGGVVKPEQKHVSRRSINTVMAGMRRR